MLGSRTRVWTWLAAAAVGLALAAPASATTDVLKRSLENMPQGAVDMLLSPFTAGKVIYTNLQTIDDSTAVKVAYPVPGYFWNLMAQSGGGLIRMLTGVMELPVGIALLFTDAEMEPLFDPVEDADALITMDDYEDIYRVKVGVDYTASG
jgi:hypothetical protein